ncbi:glycosyltransferase family 2 protein [Buttiauxella agrestis]|uniref:glycosyltransferase family 2 protein n=1 Tax=Buttiauxella agrestis TaxID=82977 RepID=UPI0039759302
MKLIDIALATYNGELYIREQIESIINQTYRNWRLLISDDNSTDSTVAIITELMDKDERIILVSTARQGGVVRNFNNALLATTTEFVVLSDQDDIWPVDRLEKMMAKIESIENENPTKPILVFTDLTLVNESNDLIAPSFYMANKIGPLSNMKDNNLLWRSTVYGCSTIMNRNLLNVTLPIPDFALMHDHWLALVANQNNGLYYYNYASVRYRQHANNVVGGSNKNLMHKIRVLRKSIKLISSQADKTKKMLAKHPTFYKENNPGKNNVNYCSFAFKEIFPNIFTGNKKIFSLFTFVSFVIKK